MNAPLTEREQRAASFLFELWGELFHLENRLALLKAYAEKEQEAGSPHHGLALYLADELARARSLAQKVGDFSWSEAKVKP